VSSMRSRTRGAEVPGPPVDSAMRRAGATPVFAVAPGLVSAYGSCSSRRRSGIRVGARWGKLGRDWSLDYSSRLGRCGGLSRGWRSDRRRCHQHGRSGRRGWQRSSLCVRTRRCPSGDAANDGREHKTCVDPAPTYRLGLCDHVVPSRQPPQARQCAAPKTGANFASLRGGPVVRGVQKGHKWAGESKQVVPTTATC
jgi:hypothetical protein